MKTKLRGLVVMAAAAPIMLLLQTLAPSPSASASATTTYAETTGGVAHTWTNYLNAGGNEGPSIPAYDTVQIACRLTGFKVADGNTWWYQIASSPWSDSYYVSADAFYNNGKTSGPLKGTPFVDPNVRICGTNPQGGTKETVGGATHTWTNPANAGGTQGPTISAYTTVSIACRLTGFKVADGNTWWYLVESAPWDSQFYASADAFYNNGQTSGTLKGTPFVDPNVPICSSGNGGQGSPGNTYTETAGGSAHTWSDYSDAGGTQGQTIGAYSSVQVACKVTGFRVADGNTWWYQIASSPWSDSYYVSADAFYNNGQTSGPLKGTPFVDSGVPNCSTAGSPKPDGETTGGVVHTWTNYTNAGGEAGPVIAQGTTVSVACRVTGFAVADGDTWWYLVASSPWDSVYYVSADPFYNNGQTSGPLSGTPFVDTSVPMCTANQERPGYGTAIGSSSAAVNRNGCRAADPVNCASGDFYQTFIDISVPGRGPALDLTRTYNDQNDTSIGIFGYGWNSSYDQHLTFNSDGSITITLADGSQVIAEPNASGGYTLPAWADSTLVENSNSTYTYTKQATQILTFAAGSYSSSDSTGGQLLSIADLNGYATTLAYNFAGQLSTVTDPSGRTIQVSFGSNGFVSSVTDPLGRTTSYGYDSAGDLTTVTDPMSRTWQFTYNSSHQMQTMTDPLGNTTTNTYNSSGQVTQQTDPAGLTTTFAYTGDNFSSLGGTTTVTDPHGNVEVEQYVNGFLTTLTKASGTSAAGTWTYTYDPNTYGITSLIDPDGNTTSYTYNSTGQVLTTTDPLGNITTNTYNSLGEVLTATDPLGNVTTNTYDSNGNLLTTTDPQGDVTTYTYGDGNPGDVTSITQPNGDATAMTYDNYGDVTSRSVSPSLGVTDTTGYVYDADGELVCQASANATAAGASCPAVGGARVAGTTTTTYDSDGEVTSVSDPDGGLTSYVYDADGNRVAVADPDGNITLSTYDPDNRLASTIAGTNGASPSTTTYAYDVPPGSGACQAISAASYCSTTTNANGGEKVDYYNARDELTQRTLPGGQSTQYNYDAAGNKTGMTTATRGTITYSYDADSRLIATNYSDGTPSVTYGYDADGHRTSMSDGTGTTTYDYDAGGRLTSVTNGAGATVAYSYDPSGNITSIAYPGGHAATRNYNSAGWLASVTDWLGNTTSFSYDADGNLTTTNYPSGDTVASTYNGDDSETGTSVGGSGTTLASIQYARNADNLITQETDGGALSGTTNYSYSAQNQLTSSGNGTYGYDPAGNLTSQPNGSQTFNATAELTSSTSGSHSVTYTYDADGDRTTASLPSGTATNYTYNEIGQLTSVAQVHPVPAVSGLSTSAGPTQGGTTVTITGTGFTGTSAVFFGTVSATSFTVVSDTEIMATSPAQSAGTVDVTVTTPGGTSATGTPDQFTYAPVPAVTGVSSASGPLAGGTTLTITGTGFNEASSISFGSVPAASFTVTSNTQIMATSPAQSAGTVDVTVTTPGGTSATGTPDQFTYAPVPAVTGVSSASGPLAGGTTLTITGTGFNEASSISFGSVPAASFTVTSNTQITATSPAQSAGTVDVTVTTPGGTSATGTPDQFTYAPVSAITAVSPSAGSTSGGTTVTITGTGFTGTTAVSFGPDPATSFNVVSDTQLTATAPAQSAGSVDVTVTTPGGTSAIGSADQFTYSPAPAITNITPQSGPLNGGITVTINGSGFTNASSVSFGSVPAASFTVASGTQITAVSPQEPAGTVDITVTTPGGASPASSADQFTYQTAPAVTKVSPSTGPTNGGTTVTVTGSGFTGNSIVSFGTVPAANSKVVSGTQITATSPGHAAGAVDITVTTAGGTSATVSADQFTYAPVPTVSTIAPAAGPVSGGTMVTIIGTGFTGVSAAKFGSHASKFTVVSSTQITATAPAQSAGSVNITVTTPGGTSTDVTVDKFTYLPRPAITKISPTSGTQKGGTTVTITGTGFTDATSAQFGTALGKKLTVVSPTKITVVSPTHATGTVAITVTTPGGSSSAVAADKFTYKVAAASRRMGARAAIKPDLISDTIASYSYNGDGLRATETTGAGTLNFTWDTNEATPQVISDSNNFYIYGPSGLPIEQIGTSGTSSYFFQDANGSTRILLTSSGAVGTTFNYSPYGALISQTGNLTTSLLYGQGYTDSATELIYLVNRYYDPMTGQFMSVDPELDLTMDPYSYAGNDPVNVIDPLGEWGLNPLSDLRQAAVSSWQFTDRNAKAIGGAVVIIGLGALDAWLTWTYGSGGILDPGPSGPSTGLPQGPISDAQPVPRQITLASELTSSNHSIPALACYTG